MKIIALGGSGGMGRYALSVLASEHPVDEVIVADINEKTAADTAEELRSKGQPASSRQIDVSDATALRRLFTEGDLVMNSVGPYFRFGVPVLQAAIDTGRNYIDICDDAEPTLEMFALHDQARDAGITAVIGAGASPGFMNMMARTAAEGMDQIDDIIVGWTINNTTRGWDLMRGPKSRGIAATVHFFEQFTGTVPVWESGRVVRRRAREAIDINLSGLGSGTGYVVGHPEPLTLPPSLKARGRAVSICMLGSDRAALLDDLARDIEDNGKTLEEAATDLRVAVASSVTHPRAQAFADGGNLPTYFVVLTGERQGKSVVQYAGCLSKPEPMTIGTGVPYGVATALFATESATCPAGVFALDAVLQPDTFFEKVSKRWGVARDDLFFLGSAHADHPDMRTRADV